MENRELNLDGHIQADGLEDFANKIFGHKDLSDEEKYDKIMKEAKEAFKYQESIGNPYSFHKSFEYAIRKCKKEGFEL